MESGAAVSVEKYSPEHKTAWDALVATSRNGTFLLQRNYMEYHADRFTDHSLLFFWKGRLVALLPANEAGDAIHSHGGLTYGGIISGNSMKVTQMLQVFEVLRAYYRSQGFKKLIYKAVPHIYHRVPAEEDLYALFRHQALLFRSDVSSVIDLQHPIGYTSKRRWQISKVAKSGLTVSLSADFECFMQIEQQLLEAKYKTRPVHTATELQKLARLFPENIRLYAALDKGAMVAGVVIYATERVAHCQYIASTAEGRALYAPDAIIHALLTEVYAHKKYFSFGISTEQQGQYLNEGLIRNKESYGARAVVHDFYELAL